ncbi:MAG: hypothetical protein ACOY0T_35295 [Myxococcota bacterium]
MESREQLRVHALRAYEFGRLRAASRVAFVLVPLALVCLYETRGRELCGCLAAALLGVCVWLRWRNRQGFENVSTGLRAGSIPLAAGLLLDRFDLRCSLSGAESFCTIFAVGIGSAAGVLIALRERNWDARLSSWLTAGAIAALAASLGCLRLGVVGLASVVAGIALGTLVTARLAVRES